MPIKQKKFLEYLMLYGPDIETWPEDKKAEGIWVCHKPPFSLLVAEQQRFEAVLQQRGFEPAHPGLADRIIAKARPVAIRQSFKLSVWFNQLLPKPAFAFATVLALGFVLGFSTLAAHAPATQEMPNAFYLDDESSIL